LRARPVRRTLVTVRPFPDPGARVALRPFPLRVAQATIALVASGDTAAILATARTALHAVVPVPLPARWVQRKVIHTVEHPVAIGVALR
jgi:hypothetical protein